MLYLHAQGHRVAILVRDRPLGIADVIIHHHAFPLASCQHIIIIVAQLLVFLHQDLHTEAVAHGGMIVYFCHTSTSHHWIINQLVESILLFLRHLLAQQLSPFHQRLPTL